MLKAKEIQAIRKGTMDADELIANYPIKSLVADLIEMLKIQPEPVAPATEEKQKPIAVSQEEYDRILSIFRVKGLTATGEKTKRGRPSKKTEE